jgi:hypothetical protein
MRDRAPLEPRVDERDTAAPVERRQATTQQAPDRLRNSNQTWLDRAQFELVVGSVDDPAEAEADRIADEVLRRIGDGSSHSATPTAAGAGDPFGSTRIARSATTSNGTGAPIDESLAHSITAARGAGAPIPDRIRGSMEPAFGADLSAVKFHTGSHVDRLNEQLGARAFTVGSDVFFRGGMPGTDRESTRLVAHELAHTMQQEGGGSRIAQRSAVVRRDTIADPSLKISAADRQLAERLALEYFQAATEREAEYAFKGLGGGGAALHRSAEIRKFRKVVKTDAREQVFSDLGTLAKGATDPKATATSDYREMIGGNIAYGAVKNTIDEQLEVEKYKIVPDAELNRYRTLVFRVAIHALSRHPGDEAAARAEADIIAKSQADSLRAATRRNKDAVVGKRNEQGERTGSKWTMTDKGKQVSANIADKVHDDDVAQKSLDKAITAPSMNKGLRILGKLIDNVITGAGEAVSLSIEFTIPTGTPGLVVVINMNGMASRGTDGAATAGVTKLGNPKRVEMSAKFSVGVGAEAVGLKSSGTVGIFVRAGSDDGTSAAIEALSYGAYRGASPEAFQNLWAPEDKASEHHKNKRKATEKLLAASGATGGTANNARPGERTARQRAEMWAAMVEEQRFGKASSAFADVGMAVDGSFGVNLSAVEIEATIGQVIFSHYDNEVLEKALGSDFGARVLDDAMAKERRKAATGDKRMELSASLSFKLEALGHVLEFAAAVSGGGPKNWGVEITAGFGMPEGDPASMADQIVNKYIGGVGEMIKRIRDTFAKGLDDDTTGIAGSLAQMPADTATVLDAGNANAITDAIGKIHQYETPVSEFDTKLGDTHQASTEMSKMIGVTSSLEFALMFGLNNGEFVVRFELRSKRGIDVGSGSPMKVSGAKTTRLLAIGRDGKKGAVGELFGGRIDSKES